jgi:hypothetical protein
MRSFYLVQLDTELGRGTWTDVHLVEDKEASMLIYQMKGATYYDIDNSVPKSISADNKSLLDAFTGAKKYTLQMDESMMHCRWTHTKEDESKEMLDLNSFIIVGALQIHLIQ